MTQLSSQENMTGLYRHHTVDLGHGDHEPLEEGKRRGREGEGERGGGRKTEGRDS